MVIFEFSPASSPIPTVTTLTLYFLHHPRYERLFDLKRRYLIDGDSVTSELYETASDVEISAVSVDRKVIISHELLYQTVDCREYHQYQGDESAKSILYKAGKPKDTDIPYSA